MKTTGSVGTDYVSLANTSTGVLRTEDGFCSWAEPIYWSKLDTPETVKQIKLKHNVPYAAKCPQAAPPH